MSAVDNEHVKSGSNNTPTAPIDDFTYDYSKCVYSTTVTQTPSLGMLDSVHQPLSTSSASQNLPKTRNIESTSILHTDEAMFKPRKSMQHKVFAGRKRNLGEIQTLKTTCQKVLFANMHLISSVGNVSYALLKPVLQNASMHQLRRILQTNPMLINDADELFYQQIRREFPTHTHEKKNGQTWRQTYDRLVLQKEQKESEKLATVVSRIGKARGAVEQEVRKTIPIDVGHRNNSNNTPNMATQSAMIETPNASSRSRKRVHGDTSVTKAVNEVCGGASNSSNRRTAGPTTAKKAPMMAKCLRMMKNRLK